MWIQIGAPRKTCPEEAMELVQTATKHVSQLLGYHLRSQERD